MIPDATPARRPLKLGLVARPRLVRRLTGSAGPSLVVVVAPAGYGKTTLLRQWELSDARPFHWLGPDEIDDLADRAERARGTVLVLDDFHVHARRSPRRLDAVRRAIEDPNADGLIVIAARSEPELPVGRLRAQAAVVELRVRDLAMTEREAAQLLRRAGLFLRMEDVAALVRRTEGWPVGLFLAALSLGEQHDVGAAIAEFGGDDRLVSDYLRDEVMASLSTEEAAFLRRTSPLDELSGPLCDAVLDQRGSGRVLRDLARSNLLLAPLDRSEEHFRYHGLLADMLRSELRRGEPDRAHEVHRRASAWHEQRGDTDRAIEHAIAAGALDRAGELLWGTVAAGAGGDEAVTTEHWLGRLRDRQIASRPELALSAAIAAILRGDRDEAERWAQAGARSLELARPELRRSLETGAAMVRALIGRGGLAQIAADADRTYDLAAADGAWRATARLLAGVAHHLTGHRARAVAELEEGAALAAHTAPAVQADCLAQLAVIALEDRDWEQGAALSTRALEQAERADGVVGRRTCALAFAASAFACAQQGEVQRAREDVVEARRRLDQLADPPPWYDAEIRILLARAQLRLSNAAEARSLLAQASRALRREPDATVLKAWIDDAWERADAFAVGAVASPATLTTAELRVLRFLPSHLSFREVAARLHVSANTVKTQAHAIYRKLDASSRSEAVDRARDVGLIGG